MSLRDNLWGSMMVLILLPLCACLDVQSVTVVTQTIHPGSQVRLILQFAPPTTEGWESGEQAIGLLCLRMPAGWHFVKGNWTIAGGKSGTVLICDRIKPSLEAGEDGTAMVLCSDQSINRNDLAGDISAEIFIATGTQSGLFSLLLLGGATDAGYSDVIWSNTAALRQDITVE